MKMKTINLLWEWRSQKATNFFRLLDECHEDSKTTMAKRQSKKRILSDTASLRCVPEGNYPKWAVRTSGKIN